MALWIRTVDPVSGRGWDITDQVDNLVWSSTNPGGDERASFSLLRDWFAGAPSIAQGNVVRVGDNLDVLWTGRIEENDRQVQSALQIGVTAYGLGIRLKDQNDYREIIVDRDLSQWRGASVQRKINNATTGATE